VGLGDFRGWRRVWTSDKGTLGRKRQTELPKGSWPGGRSVPVPGVAATAWVVQARPKPSDRDKISLTPQDRGVRASICAVFAVNWYSMTGVTIRPSGATVGAEGAAGASHLVLVKITEDQGRGGAGKLATLILRCYSGRRGGWKG